jgi:hypothetical protein
VDGCDSGAMGYDEVVQHGLFAHPELHRDVPPEAGIADEPPSAVRLKAADVKAAVERSSRLALGAFPPEAGIGDEPPPAVRQAAADVKEAVERSESSMR